MARWWIVSGAAALVAMGCSAGGSNPGNGGAGGEDEWSGSSSSSSGNGGNGGNGGAGMGGGGGASSSSSASSSGSMADCKGLFGGTCGPCLEATCCSELAACNATAGCMDCIAGSQGACNANNQAAAQAISQCASASCSAECFGAAAGDPICNVPAQPPSGGSCVTIGGAIQCNPVTNQPCNTAAGDACDADSTGGYSCFGPPNNASICGNCDVSAGPFCKATHTCADGKCAKFCCTDADCGSGKCDIGAGSLPGGVGICIVGGGGGPTTCGQNGVCLAQAPAGWTSPTAVFQGAGPLPACPAAYPTAIYDGHGSLACGSHTCTPCACNGKPMGGSCSSYSSLLKMYTTADDCTGTFYQNQTSGPGCYNLVMPVVGVQSVEMAATPAVGGTCAPPSGGVKNAGTPTWGSDVRICGAPATSMGCAASEICAEKPAAPYGAQICIAREGVHDCPAAPSPYTNKSVFYTDYTDTRSCSSCSCSVANMFCSQTIDLYQSLNCGEPKFTKTLGFTCDATAGVIDTIRGYQVNAPALSGFETCNVGPQSMPQGSCAPNAQTGAFTLCCAN